MGRIVVTLVCLAVAVGLTRPSEAETPGAFSIPGLRPLSVGDADTSGPWNDVAAGLVRPTALGQGDFDSDGVPDLVAGYAGDGNGFVTLQRGNVDAIFPHSVAARQRRAAGTFVDQPFLTPARVFSAPVPPDFLGVGDFDNDGNLDVVVGALGGEALHLLSGDGAGVLRAAETVELPGALTAMVTGEINRRDGLADLVVGLRGSDGSELLVFEGPEGALRSEAEVLPVPAEPTALLLARLGEAPWFDLAAAVGDELIIVRGRDRKLMLGEKRRAEVDPPIVESFEMASAIDSLAWGDFAAEPTPRGELALLLEDGTLRLLDGAGDSIGERDVLPSQMRDASTPAGSSRLLPVRLSGSPTEDLTVFDVPGRRLLLLAGMMRKDPGTHGAAALSSTGVVASLDLPAPPVAVLPMRLNRDAWTDLVLLLPGNVEPLVAESAPLATITVNTAADTAIASDGLCTLREAINNSNNNSDTTGGDCVAGAGTDTIEFNIGGGGSTATIAPTSALPTNTDSVTIDGTTQGCASPPCVVLDGSGAGFVAAGLTLAGGSSSLRGFVIQQSQGDVLPLRGFGILLTSSGNIVEGNYSGTDVTGTVGLGNYGAGVRIDDGSNNTIGGAVAAAGNVISASVDGAGIFISNTGSSEDNQILGNFIGTDRTGTAGLGNRYDGVGINTASNNTIGGTSAGAGNVISANGDEGIWIGDATGNLVLGNHIGTDVNGTAGLGNGTSTPDFGEGVYLSGVASANTIGGTAPGARNIVSDSSGGGVRLDDGSTNVVLGNFIGTDVTGTVDLGNTWEGILLLNATNNTIGGTVDGARNLISANGAEGIRVSTGTDNQLQGNLIGVDVSGASPLGNGNTGVRLHVLSDDNTIGGTSAGAGNVISGNGGGGIWIENGTQNLVLGNLIGTDVTGTVALGNGTFPGIEIGSSGNTVGGTSAGSRNVISGNDPDGVFFNGAGATANEVLGNFIGTDITGTVGLGNAANGIELQGASNNRVGDDMPEGRNVISDNGVNGIHMNNSTLIDVQGNFIGTDATGTVTLGNGLRGVRMVNSPNNTIGGGDPGEGNVISANGTIGVQILGAAAQDNDVKGNFIGTDVTGTVALGNLLAGIEIESASNNTIGGTTGGDRNVISGNGPVEGWGVVLQAADGNEVLGNLIGLQVDGVSPLGNALGGVITADGASDNTIGGIGVTPGRCDGPCNRIGFNAGATLNDGVRIFAGSGNGNAILGNSIHMSAELGIDLGPSGVTLNDPGDGDVGANTLQNFPVLGLAEATPASATIDGALNSTANRPFRVEFFASLSCDASGHGEGARYLGFADVTTDLGGNVSFSAPVTGPVSDGEVITATATSMQGSTSEFSACVDATCLSTAVFGETILAPDENSLIWATPDDVRFVKGDLVSVSSYGVIATGELPGATSLDISADAPGAGSGVYYLIRSLACGSWQTVPGAEPGRDIGLP